MLQGNEVFVWKEREKEIILVWDRQKRKLIEILDSLYQLSRESWFFLLRHFRVKSAWTFSLILLEELQDFECDLVI